MFTFNLLRALPSCSHFMTADKLLSPPQQIGSAPPPVDTISVSLFGKFSFPCVFLFMATRLWCVFQYVPLSLRLETISRYFCIRYIFFARRLIIHNKHAIFIFLCAQRLQTDLWITDTQGICGEANRRDVILRRQWHSS